MAHVNLLPWREKLRQHQKQQYIGALGAVAAIVGLVCWFIGQAIDQQISNQNVRNNYIQGEISALDSQISQIQKIKESKNAIEQRMALIEQLQVSRNVAPAVFDELARIVPPGVFFKSMRRIGNTIQMEGVSDSNIRLSDFMRRLDASTVFSGGELSSIVADTSERDAVSDFTLKFTISPNIAPPQPEDEISTGGKK
ncbi:PilN domain-containing protein [Alteromonas pelagimontana]|uniref:PilN domain-containing protein n=1 Tax=Alteromonas pelagimontana TaxID=1858656 RepID=A0A6M4MBY9_9ALTE|nr:PilN domain-containing protein [Alteromonas pelagimontana]QJR80549.1 PilN domain-containing protein [Alteromonas pelagimontana]